MQISEQGFVHLRVYSEYSLLKAVTRLEDIMKKAKSWNMNSLAITDKHSISGVIKFYELAEKYGIHPIIGCELKIEADGDSLILLAATNKGYEQIVKWLNHGFEPPLFHGDIIALSGGRNGSISRLLAEGKIELATQKALQYLNWFGKENFYIEVQDYGFADDRVLIDKTIQLSDKTGIPLVATHDFHFSIPEDAFIVDILQKFPSPTEMKEKFRDIPNAITNTVRIAERCQFRLEKGRFRLPNFPLPEDQNEEEYLKQLCLEGLNKRFSIDALAESKKQKIFKRLETELTVINSRGLVSYFLIVWDIVQYAKKRQIPIGPGRGSAVGSLVVYLLGITEVNPLVYELSFERFLSPDRTDLPDIDLDVCQIRRQEILQYLKEKYGENQVAHIGVLNTFGTRGAVREAGRYLNLPKEQVNLLTKLLPAFSGKGGIRHSLNTLPELTKLPINKEPYKSLFNLAESIEGLPSNYSSHPSGVLIGQENLEHLIPLKRRPNHELMTFFNKDDIKTLGLLKVDLLGSRILTIIYDTLQAIYQNTDKRIELKNIPLDDNTTFQTINKGETLGCFQLESMGIRNLMRRMKPTDIEELTALLALYRPGSWQEGIVEKYLSRKNDKEEVDYLLPELKPILEKTYGLILYQEQVMQIAHVIAGYSMAEADALRRALAKKNIDTLLYHQERFVFGANLNGKSKEAAANIFDFLVSFAGYSFNKAHSVSYAYISYWTVYLKTHYPKEYMASLLSLEGGYYPKKVYLREIIKMEIPIYKPDINRSGFGFMAEKDGIRFGIDAIKGSGQEAVTSLLSARYKGGNFTSFQDLVQRLKAYHVNAAVIKAWIGSGACDGLELNRKQMLSLLEASQLNIFEDNPVKSIKDFSETEKKKMEKRLLGFSLEQYPSAKWQQFFKQYKIILIKDLAKLKNNTRVRISGSIVHSKRQPTKNDQYFLILVLQDNTEMVEIIVDPTTYNSYLYQLNPEGIIVEGILRTGQGLPQLIAEKIKALGE